MRSQSQARIIEFIKKKGVGRPSELARTLRITPQALHRHLRGLCSQGVLIREGEPPKTCYRIGDSSALSKQSPLPFVAPLKEIWASHPAVGLVTMFGSVARGTARPESDIDILVWLSPNEKLTRHDLWQYWDRHARALRWAPRVSIVVYHLRSRLSISTLLLDLPEEHILIYDRKDWFLRIKNAVLAWRERNGSEKLPSFGGKHAWKYSRYAKHLDDIDFNLEIGNVP